MNIVVIDGQGGGIGKCIVEKIREKFGKSMEIIVLGTNGLATSAMLRAGADKGATGENAIVVNSKEADIIVGTVGIIQANSMLGELTPRMAEAVASSCAQKILIPLNKCNLEIVGISAESLSQQIECLVGRMEEYINCSQDKI